MEGAAVSRSRSPSERGEEAARRTLDVNLLAIGIQDVELAVLVGDTLSALSEGLDSGISPPLAVEALVVVLGTGDGRTDHPPHPGK